MKYATDRPYADPEAAARKLLETAITIEAIQDTPLALQRAMPNPERGCSGNTNPGPT